MTSVHGPDFLAIQVRDLEGSADFYRTRGVPVTARR
jgi:hypothetical protein